MLDERDQLLPLLISAAHLTANTAQRTTLLQAMFDLFKRPDAARRQLIVVACTQLAAIAHQGVLEESLLPVCWEHMAHKTAEHRQMTAQVCAALMPYVSVMLLTLTETKTTYAPVAIAFGQFDSVNAATAICR